MANTPKHPSLSHRFSVGKPPAKRCPHALLGSHHQGQAALQELYGLNQSLEHLKDEASAALGRNALFRPVLAPAYVRPSGP